MNFQIKSWETDMKTKLRFMIVAICMGLLISCTQHSNSAKLTAAQAGSISVKQLEGKIRVDMGGKLFTEYVYADTPRPMLYPIIGPSGVPMTRNYPMKNVPGEAKDHPHHRSLCYSHGDMNGIDFWSDGKGKGKIVQDAVLETTAIGNVGTIKTRNKWVGPDGETICTDVRTIRCQALPGGRAIDWEITIIASAGDLTIGDTKEGCMSIRTRPELRLKNNPKRGVTTANGHALNSAGDRDKKLWGKRAAWVDYWGAVDGATVGIAIFGHPSNPRHPTWWHARDYGLVAVNPFGISYFERKSRGTGDMKIKSGDSATFRYRFLFHEGDVEKARISRCYKIWAEQAKPY
jgi:Family of unknown function (DUF6807)